MPGVHLFQHPRKQKSVLPGGSFSATAHPPAPSSPLSASLTAAPGRARCPNLATCPFLAESAFSPMIHRSFPKAAASFSRSTAPRSKRPCDSSWRHESPGAAGVAEASSSKSTSCKSGDCSGFIEEFFVFSALAEDKHLEKALWPEASARAQGGRPGWRMRPPLP
jgi:hypothetical protein